MYNPKDPSEELCKLFEKLAKAIGLVSGTIQLTFSEARAVKIEVAAHSWAKCVRRKTNEWKIGVSNVQLKMDAAPDFVTRYMESVIVARIGRFGSVAARLDDGHVTGLSTFEPRRPPPEE